MGRWGDGGRERKGEVEKIAKGKDGERKGEEGGRGRKGEEGRGRGRKVKDGERKGEGRNVYTHTKSTPQNVPLRIISYHIYCHHHQSRQHR